MKKTKTPKTLATGDKPTLICLLLDRTGSMEQCRVETIKGFNGYIDGLRKEPGAKTARFTLTQFDSQAVDLLHDAVPLDQVMTLTEKNYLPRASTPLYDAIGKTIRSTQSSAGDKYKVLFVTLTDGQENASSEWDLGKVNALIKEMEREKHWTFAHIGVGVAGWEAGRQYLTGTQGLSNVMKSAHGTASQRAAYRSFAGATASYMSNKSAGGQCVSNIFGTDDEDSLDKTKETE